MNEISSSTKNKTHNGAKRRSAISKKAILDATYETLCQEGFRGLTIEGIAARAGVGKATIYRWWSTKGELSVEAFLTHITPMIEYVSTGSSRQDISMQMRRLAKTFSGKDGKIVREMLAMGQFNADTLELFKRGYLEPRRDAARKVLKQGIEQGQFRHDFDIEAIIDALYGPLYHRLLLNRPIDDESFLSSVESSVLISILPTDTDFTSHS